MLKLGVNAEARRFSEPGAGIPHAGIFGGAGGQLPVLRYQRNTSQFSQFFKFELNNFSGPDSTTFQLDAC